MALVCDVELDSGLAIRNAYLRIGSFSGTETNLSFILNIFADKTAYTEGKPAVSSASYSIPFDPTSNLFRQAYEYLRTLPEYEDAVEA